MFCIKSLYSKNFAENICKKIFGHGTILSLKNTSGSVFINDWSLMNAVADRRNIHSTPKNVFL